MDHGCRTRGRTHPYLLLSVHYSHEVGSFLPGELASRGQKFQRKKESDQTREDKCHGKNIKLSLLRSL